MEKSPVFMVKSPVFMVKSPFFPANFRQSGQRTKRCGRCLCSAPQIRAARRSALCCGRPSCRASRRRKNQGVHQRKWRDPGFWMDFGWIVWAKCGKLMVNRWFVPWFSSHEFDWNLVMAILGWKVGRFKQETCWIHRQWVYIGSSQPKDLGVSENVVKPTRPQGCEFKKDYGAKP